MILVTTSRKPSRPTRRFGRNLASVLPYGEYVNRGKGSIEDIVERAYVEGFLRVLIIGETKGNPSIIRGIKVGETWEWIGQIYISVLSYGERIKVDAESLGVETESFPQLKDFFDVYGSEEPDILLVERDGIVHFEMNGEVVGPRFRVKGIEKVPEKLLLQLRRR